MKYLFTFLTVLVALACAPNAQAQQADALLFGHLTTEDGRPLPDASVLVVHVPTGLRRAAVTDTTGTFGVGEVLSGGPFVVQVSRFGYRTQLVSNVFLRSGEPLRLDIILAADAATTTRNRTIRATAAR